MAMKISRGDPDGSSEESSHALGTRGPVSLEIWATVC